MTTATTNLGRLTWLHETLSEQQGLLAALMRRLMCLSVPGVKRSVFNKFLNTLRQIAVEKELENAIIDRIHAMEAHHCLQRECNKLRSALPAPGFSMNENDGMDDGQEHNRSDNSFWLIMGLIYLLSMRGPKPQE